MMKTSTTNNAYQSLNQNKAKGLKNETIQAILNFSKSLEVSKSKQVGNINIILN